MLDLIPEVADFAMKLADTNVLKGEHPFLISASNNFAKATSGVFNSGVPKKVVEFQTKFAKLKEDYDRCINQESLKATIEAGEC